MATNGRGSVDGATRSSYYMATFKVLACFAMGGNKTGKCRSFSRRYSQGVSGVSSRRIYRDESSATYRRSPYESRGGADGSGGHVAQIGVSTYSKDEGLS